MAFTIGENIRWILCLGLTTTNWMHCPLQLPSIEKRVYTIGLCGHFIDGTVIPFKEICVAMVRVGWNRKIRLVDGSIFLVTEDQGCKLATYIVVLHSCKSENPACALATATKASTAIALTADGIVGLVCGKLSCNGRIYAQTNWVAGNGLLDRNFFQTHGWWKGPAFYQSLRNGNI